MKKILLINLGGTISCKPSKKGLIPTKGPNYFIKTVPLLEENAKIDAIQLLKRTIVFPSDWLVISKYILKERNNYNGIVITLGTDTLAYVSSALSFLLNGIKIPIVLTGAMQPLTAKNSDAKKNLINSVLFATSNNEGIFVVFGNKVIRGARASKINSVSNEAFESINLPIYATINNQTISYNKYLKNKPKNNIKHNHDKLNTNVVSYIINPQTKATDLKKLKTYDGAVIISYGDGNIPNHLVPPIKDLLDRGKPIIIASQCTFGPTKHKYVGGKAVIKAGAISSKDMTKEACITKLMWCLGQTKDHKKVNEMMLYSYCDEISP